MADIFISYSQLDQEQVSTLASLLKSQGYSVWWDKPFDSEEEFQKKIRKQREIAKAIIVAWSVESIKSDYIKADIKTAAENKVLFPVKTEQQTEDYQSILDEVEKIVPKPPRSKFLWKKFRNQLLSLIGILGAG